MKTIKTIALSAVILSALLAWHSAAQAQVVYGQRLGLLAIFELEDCTFCEKFPLPTCSAPDITVLTDGRIIWTCNQGGNLYDTLGNVINSFSCPHEIHSTCMHNDTFYLGTSGGLYTLDLVNYQTAFIGDFPAGMPSEVGLYSLNGSLYCANLDNAGGRPIWQVNTADPSASVFIQNMPNGTLQPRGVGSLNGLMYFSTGNTAGFPNRIWIYDQVTNTVIPTPCTYGNTGIFWGVSVMPSATAPLSCPCVTSAGTIPGGPINLCNLGNAVASSAVSVVLQNNDILRYLLVTNTADIVNSILAVSTTPSFAFNPATMSVGTTYYIVAAAGDNQSGNINYNDPCLSFSNAIPVTWRSLPSVSLVADNTNLCAGTCSMITATLTGNPPFSLTYTTPFGNGTQSFSNNTGAFEVCIPFGANAGPLVVQATVLTDAHCTCQ